MEMSAQINEIATAMAKAQATIKGAGKDSANPFYKSNYASLESVREACIGPLTANGIAVFQSPSTDGPKVTVVTMLAHTSGQWIRGSISAVAKDDGPQSVGSAVSYLRRYSLQSFAGVAPTDDDGEAAEGRGRTQAATPVTTKPAPAEPHGFDDWLTDLAAVAQEGTRKLQKTWETSKPEYRKYLTTVHPKNWENLKALAAKVTEQVPA